MQQIYNSNINIKFIIITTDISFIPDCILNYCQHIKLSRPSRCTYNRFFKTKLTTNNNISTIINIKDLKNTIVPSNKPSNKYEEIEKSKVICNQILEKILDINKLKYLQLREFLYDICIFDLNIVDCIWYIVGKLIEKEMIDNKKLNMILIQTYLFFKLYNNNYRPIYHLEKYILYITTIIHEL